MDFITWKKIQLDVANDNLLSCKYTNVNNDHKRVVLSGGAGARSSVAFGWYGVVLGSRWRGRLGLPEVALGWVFVSWYCWSRYVAVFHIRGVPPPLLMVAFFLVLLALAFRPLVSKNKNKNVNNESF